ncbi:MAG: CpaD family pilus assembly protein [Pseudolabrys sp.]|nr:CpaD family pilus assembly protein [Pseudolabrys sp.]
MAQFKSASRRTRPLLQLIAAGSLAAMLAGCNSAREQLASYPNDYRERHPITLREGQKTVEVFLGTSRGGLSPAQRADVLAFAAAWKREATGGILVEVPANGPSARTAQDSLREIHSILAANAVPQNGVLVRSYAPSPFALASIRMTYPKLVAEAGPCGRWPNDLGPSEDPTYVQNKPYWNFGCASQRNLASMVDNPTDLVQPRGESQVYTARRAIALDKYRKGENPTALYQGDSSGFDQGKVSDLGK